MSNFLQSHRTKNLSDTRLIDYTNGITAYISSIFRYIALLCTSKWRKSALGFLLGLPRLLNNESTAIDLVHLLDIFAQKMKRMQCIDF